jgi:hypothetical protein
MPYDIIKSGNEFKLVLDRNGKVLGTHPSKAAAKKQIAAIEASKHSK